MKGKGEKKAEEGQCVRVQEEEKAGGGVGMRGSLL